MFYTPPQIKQRWGILPEDRSSVADSMQDYEDDDARDRDYSQHPPSDEEFWQHRREENDWRSPGFEADVRNDGIHNPVTLGRQFIQDGHHRIAAADDNQLIPATHTDDPREVGKTSPVTFHADGYRYPSPNDGDDGYDNEYEPANPRHRLVGGTYDDYLRNTQ